ncbi:beta-lactamase class A [Marinospirillum alkaliphilum DSM 21637]|uniref:Beta-lactamase n=1 Tax=Marinospirillum alkaliphilum DSM 21637 TaxID=1122209 RepID=A0A1K1XG11_9GAMM|nr:beta-lactamase class A [Marinospirillum alkaliphilum DSM 21637]
MKQSRGVIFLSGLLYAYVLFVSVPVLAQGDALVTELQRIESDLKARIGFSAHDLETGLRWEHHADQRFAMSSTFKTLACAALLQQVDENEVQIERKISFSEADLVTYSPVTEQHAGQREMSLFELCEATMTTSDNTAANLILQAIGGPEAVTEFVRGIGDDVTRLDRWETELNQATPDDERDTTTPNAMVANLEALLLGNVLSPSSRGQLREWLVGNKVADGLFRSSMPADWVIADRTGAGGFGSRSITAVIWPPERLPVVVAFYITETTASFDDRNAAIAALGRVIKDMLEAK